MKSRRHAKTHRDYHSPDNSLCTPQISLLDQSATTDSSRGLRTQLNAKEIELLQLYSKCFKWKQRCRAQEERVKCLTEQLRKAEEMCKVLTDKYSVQKQAAKAYEERRRGIEHFQIKESSASVRMQQTQIESLQSQIEALEAAQTKILSENERLRRPKQETETALRAVLADLTAVHHDVAELNKVLKVFLSREEYSVSALMGTFLSRVPSNGQDVDVWTRLVHVVRAVTREVEELRIGLAAFTESRKKGTRATD